MEWIEIKTRPLTDEEKESYYTDFMYDCEMPEYGEEVLVQLYGDILSLDTYENYDNHGTGFCNYTDEYRVVAWMPLPEPFRKVE